MVFEKNILMNFVYLFISQYLTTIVAQPIPCGPNLFTENMNQNTKIMLQESPRGLANFYRSFGKCEQIFNDSNVSP